MKRITVATTFILTLLLASLNVTAQSQSREDALRAIEAKRAELVELEKAFLSPSEADRNANSEFLAQPGTGMMRLMPREKYDADVYRDNKKLFATRGGGAYYSFTHKTHEYSENSNISLERNTLGSGFVGTSYGLLTTLGDVPLDTVNVTTPAAKALANHQPPTDEQQARTEQRRSYDGVTLDGMVFKSRLPIDVDMTYVLRSVNYTVSDSMVAFRVVRVDADGSAIIAWKLLRKFAIPQVARN